MKVVLGILFFSLGLQAQIVEIEKGRVKAQNIKYDATSAHDFRQKRKVGIFMNGLGSLGLYGVSLEFNAAKDWGVSLGFGGGSDFQAFNVQYKYVFGGASIAPYASAGITRWYTTNDQGTFSETNPGFLKEKFLNEEEIAIGRINANLIYPGLGLQYLGLKGEYAGYSAYLEISILTDLLELEIQPVAGFGFGYYF